MRCWTIMVRYYFSVLLSLALYVTTPDLFGQASYAKRYETHVKNADIRDISPNKSNLGNATAASSGRINHLAAASGFNALYAASEWGGLFKSKDRGETWEHLDSHLPTATWDVKVDPFDARIVYATSFYDGRVKSRAGINVSRNGGATWDHPESASPPEGFCSENSRADEPSAFGIAIDPNNPKNVYVGTNCGLAVSNDRGRTWQYKNPAGTTSAADVWSVIAHHGVIDICGDQGHSRSENGGLDWISDPQPLTNLGKCSLAASPDEADVIFIASDGPHSKKLLFESDSAGKRWKQIGSFPGNSRPAFVHTNRRSEDTFDLWYGARFLNVKSCRSSPSIDQTAVSRCATNPWTTFEVDNGAHDDAGDLLIGPDGCPAVYSSDGGVYIAERDEDRDCQDPFWREPSKKTPHALWLLSMSGANHRTSEQSYSCDLYLGCRDNGAFSTLNAGVATPKWNSFFPGDVSDINVDPDNIIFSECCGDKGLGASHRIILHINDQRDSDFRELVYTGEIIGGGEIDSIERFDKDSYVITTGAGVFKTKNVRDPKPEWVRLGSNGPDGICGIRVAFRQDQPTFYIQAGEIGNACLGYTQDKLFKYVGTDADHQWQPVIPPGDEGGFGIFAVSPNNPDVIIASHIIKTEGKFTSVSMVISRDGGRCWQPMRGLNDLMTGYGAVKYFNQRGPTNDTGFAGYVQPTLVAFDPVNPNIIIAGGADSGLFYSINGGLNWTVITNNSGDRNNPYIPRPGFAFIDHRPYGINLYIGTKGRGVWRIRLKKP